MTANSVSLNLYRITVDEPGNDLATLLKVAAPNARNAAATISASGLPVGSKVRLFELLQEDVPHVSIGDDVLVWEEAHGFVSRMGDTFPAIVQHRGITPESEIDWSRYKN